MLIANGVETQPILFLTHFETKSPIKSLCGFEIGNAEAEVIDRMNSELSGATCRWNETSYLGHAVLLTMLARIFLFFAFARSACRPYLGPLSIGRGRCLKDVNLS